ncbi:hypothetical protein GGI26_000478 [Coemansia sp. RSA 1358]|nr:hypothetical protein GGI26_000478 [Coemansia sp. RSA 1358]
MTAAGIEPIALRAPGQVAGYETMEIKTAYLNNIKLRFGQHLERAVNVLLNTHAEKKTLRKEMAGWPKSEFLRAIHHRQLDTSKLGPKAQRIVEQLKPILGAYSADYESAHMHIDTKILRQHILGPEHKSKDSDEMT